VNGSEDAEVAAADLPTGTVTFLFTDIEGSTRLASELRDGYAGALEEHTRLLQRAFGAHGGRVIDTQGDAFFAAFARARDALEAGLAAQRALVAHDWPAGADVRVRMGIHTGEPVVGGGRYVGLEVHRAARICAAAHGGQILLSGATRELLADELPSGCDLRELGEQRLRDLPRPERLFQLLAPGLPADFPPPRTAEDARPLPEPALRVSDAERERTVAWLRDHCAEGRLTLDEFAERTEAAYAAVTASDLETITAGLPAAPPEHRRRAKWLTFALFGRFRRRGRWRVPRRTFVVSVLSDVDFDLREAEVEPRAVTIFVLALFGNVDVYVPDVVETDVGGLVLGGHRREWGADRPPKRDVPLVRVRVLTLFGTVDVWRIPPGATGDYGTLIRSLRRGQRELPRA
jgi:class 3 adenylate cyclase